MKESRWVFVFIGILILWAGFNYVSNMALITDEEEVTAIVESDFKKDYISKRAELFEIDPKWAEERFPNIKGKYYWSVVLEITPTKYADYYIDARSGEILDKNIHDLNKGN